MTAKGSGKSKKKEAAPPKDQRDAAPLPPVDAMTAFFLAEPGDANPEYESAFREATQVSEIEQEIERYSGFARQAKSTVELGAAERRISELEDQKEKLLAQKGKDISDGAASTLIHTTKRKRRDVLSPVLELAQAQCRDPKDAAEVWVNLCSLARAKQPPLLGVTEEGVQYQQVNDEAAYLSRGALTKRLNRQN